ncbi:reverse transcriptase [Bacillus anthracis]|nr:reverse transcriptase [Bacillus anthracis]
MDFKRYHTKNYKHFDNKVSIKNAVDRVTNPCWVKRHGFYPFIHFSMEIHKYNNEMKGKEKPEPKERKIYYASHIDSFIYKYYGDLLNDMYNKLAIKRGIDSVATAYRKKSDGKCNIHFAKEVIDYIKSNNQVFIYVADFKSFFDELDHKFLKKQLQIVLEKETLPEDYYAVFKSITKYSWVDKTKIDELLQKKYKNKEKRKKLTRLLDGKDFRRFKKDNKQNVEYNKNNYGIPQGAGLSSVCSNIYLLDFDEKLKNYVKSCGGLYRRYCDDLIIVIPFKGNVASYDHSQHLNVIEQVKKQTPRLIIQEEKTKRFIYSQDKIYDENLKPSILNYLGFAFDGHNVKLREKSLFKFYCRAYKKVRLCNWKSEESGVKKYRKSLYIKYTHLGNKQKGYGNFLTYAQRAQEIFDENATTNNLMKHQVKNHWRKIQERLKNPGKQKVGK